MSLKHFHIAFITVSTLFFWGFAAWCMLVSRLPEMFLSMGWISLVCGFVMLTYGIKFMKKTKALIL